MNDTTFEARAPILDDYIYLRGYPSMDDFINFVKSNDTEQQKDSRSLAEEWRNANDHVRSLEATEAGLASNTQIAPLPESLFNLRDQVLADPIVQRTFDIVEIDVGIVDLRQLSVFQKHVNFSYVRDLQSKISKHNTPEETFKFCLLEPPAPIVKFSKVAQNGYVFVSPSNDLRFLGSVLLEPHQVTGHQLPGRAAGVIGLVAGPGANCLAVTSFDGRLILNNGTHRAAALLASGITHVPAIVQHCTRSEEIEALFSSGTYEKIKTYLELARPPMFKDYFDPALARPLKTARKLTQVKLTFGWESIEIPVV
jgi:hypothetical protein